MNEQGPDLSAAEPPPRVTSRGQVWLTVAFAVCLLAPSLYGFAGKFIEFIHIFRGNADGVFAITPVTNYLLASLGFFCMMCWALGQGMFADIERPKQHMLETEAMLDREEAARNSASKLRN